MFGRRPLALLGALVVALTLPADAYAQDICTTPASLVNSGVGKDAIPPLLRPAFVTAAEGDLIWRSEDRVLGVVINGEARAYPIPILWWHEIINDNLGGSPIALTYCPLTGSGLVFDPFVDGDFRTFGTSGLLYENNLVMYDRGKGQSLWPQLDETAVCDTAAEGQVLSLLPVVETSWGAWRRMYPDTTVVSRNTGHRRDYDVYPYGDYDELHNDFLLYPQSFIDPRLPMKDLVFGVRHDGRALAFSHTELAARGDRLVLNHTMGELRMAIVWDRASGLVLGFDRRPLVRKRNGTWKFKTLKLELVEDDAGFPFVLRDIRSETTFTLSGEVIEGKLADRIENGRLEPLADTYTAFWFAWAAFHRGTGIY